MHHEHASHHEKSSLLAFLAGAATAVAIGGYYLYGADGRRHRRKVEHWVLRAKADILERMQDTQDLTEDAYRRIVDQVTSSYASASDVGHERAERAANSFKRRWSHMREAARRAAEEARDELERDDWNEEDEVLSRSERH